MLLAILSSYGQNTTSKTNTFPTVATLTNWANYNSQQKFDLEIRALGFKFEVKEAAILQHVFDETKIWRKE